jgi:hypothetical protein
MKLQIGYQVIWMTSVMIFAQFGPGPNPSRYHRPSRCLTIAGLSGFFTLIQSRDGPDR